TEFLEKERAAEAGADAGGDAGAGSAAEAGSGAAEAGAESEFAVSESVIEAELESSSGGLPYPFHSGAELLQRCTENDMSITEIMHANELSMRSEDEIRHGLLHIYSVMEECASASLDRSGYLPGGLKVRRRAHDWYLKLKAEDPDRDPGYYLEWVNLIAMAVNEENASGGRIVTAPTNGAAGIIPAVLHYMDRFVVGEDRLGEGDGGADAPDEDGRDGGAPDEGESVDAGRASDDAVVDFLLTAGAIGILFKRNASISGAEVGCQGEVGSACAMAAAGLCAVLGGSPEQIENAAEIGLEHNLGLTCDPVGGL